MQAVRFQTTYCRKKDEIKRLNTQRTEFVPFTENRELQILDMWLQELFPDAKKSKHISEGDTQ